jgi:hypothetical protein
MYVFGDTFFLLFFLSFFLIKFSTCLFHFISSLNAIPKCLWSDVNGINLPSKWKLKFVEFFNDHWGDDFTVDAAQ